MSRCILYFIIAVLSTTAGSMTGIGGGVIMKPVLDVLGHYSVETIGILSAVTVFSMSLVSVVKLLIQGTKINYTIAILLTLGSVLGGFVGQCMLKAILAAAGADSIVTVVQNVILTLLILVVYIYMRNKGHINSLGFRGFSPVFLAGVFLGAVSSFLGIGGGPMNVALIIFLFSADTKTAAIYSLITILFAQISKLLFVTMSSGFGGFTLTMLPFMVAGAIVGGTIGARLNQRFPEKAVEACFNGVQLLILVIAVFNIVRNLI